MSTDVRTSAPAGAPSSPVGTWLLTLVTLGIYWLVWYYKVNKQVKAIDPTIEVKPGMAVVAVTFGSLLIVPPFVSIVKTGSRIAQAQRAAGVTSDCSGGVGLLLAFVLGLTPLYYQSKLNTVWADRA
ncbi:hypothetical protein AR457_03265 [Streptomyces agglomeratus]|uniref:DUF4234 domain-containing protein n=1 Tax=Streptomyces agglomeratus TaxID=285458 RepID=A0A1E5P274_9ACTN|nr:DUF4234 domain-containing protein [Streptomyces agglomeratus]OEJ23658.1 hypothetical protein AS594_03370 [Streptomyces agglomeratus]OEJ43250.1 hypothetical protein AR457_03265 [Streptomyces agglomeratus]OEJ54830.1 hypothetical protein BGK72_32505 [Streptomyces agglomeratus]OEJ62202.1 hypothetical protein BGM19_33415 [Streptomyces agglomeratus]